MSPLSTGRRLTALTAATFILSTLYAPPTLAVDPPNVKPSALPRDAPASPAQEMKQNSICATAGLLPSSDLTQLPPALTALNAPAAWRLSRGKGVKVAVIDTGIQRQPRLPVIGGGDYVVPSENGLADCDSHGTLVASLIAGRPSPTDGFSGLAPEASIISLRQTSRAYGPKNPSANGRDDETAGDVQSLARAVVHAAALGAHVINISVVSCIPANKQINQDALGAALWWAATKKDVVIVVSAGNSGDANCNQNNPIDPATPSDPRSWKKVTTISTPSWFDKYVLSVGFTSPNGSASEHSLRGPWVDVGAPGTGIVSLGTSKKTINGVPGKNGLVPIAGSSYATAFVSGLAALIRSRFPKMTAAEVISRIQKTAQPPARGFDNSIGAGVIDPVAALTYDPVETRSLISLDRQVAEPRHTVAPDTYPQTTAGVLAIGLALFFGIAIALINRWRKKHDAPNSLGEK